MPGSRRARPTVTVTRTAAFNFKFTTQSMCRFEQFRGGAKSNDDWSKRTRKTESQAFRERTRKTESQAACDRPVRPPGPPPRVKIGAPSGLLHHHYAQRDKPRAKAAALLGVGARIPASRRRSRATRVWSFGVWLPRGPRNA